MKVLLVGVGTIGEAIAVLAKDLPWVEKVVLSDYNRERVREVAQKLGRPDKFPEEWVDARDRNAIVELARKHKVDLIMNAVDPSCNEAIFDAAYEYGCTYMDMALSLSQPHPTRPYEVCGVKLGDYQFARSEAWEKKGLLALVGMGADPGMSDVFARYAAKHLFDEIEEIGVRDGADLNVRGYEFAPLFSIWTAIDECLKPPIIWEKERGWYCTEPFSDPEVFEFPEVGPLKCVNVEHEEVVLIPRWIPCKRVTFKYGLSDTFINVLQVLKMIGLDNPEPINVKGVWVAPRDVVAACLPDPAHVGDKVSGKSCVGTWVKGTKDGKPRQVYIYQVTEAETCLREYGLQPVAWQTAMCPIIAWDLLNSGAWQGKGVLGPEAFDPDPFMALTESYRFPCKIKEIPV